MSDLIKMIRGDDIANVRPEWVEQWEAWGWKVEAQEKSATRRKPAKTVETQDE